MIFTDLNLWLTGSLYQQTHYEAGSSRGSSLSTCLEGDKHERAHSEEGDGT